MQEYSSLTGFDMFILVGVQCPVGSVGTQLPISWRCKPGLQMSQPRSSSSVRSVATTGVRTTEAAQNL